MIYPALLEGEFEKLPAVLRALHSTPGRQHATGTLSIRRESALLAWLVGFPAEGENVPVRLEVRATEDEEIWTRRFGGVARSSRQRVAGGLLVEEAGPVRVAFEVRACEGGIRFEARRAWVWGIPIRLRIEAAERGGETSWEVEVRIARVGSYRGAMRLEA